MLQPELLNVLINLRSVRNVKAPVEQWGSVHCECEPKQAQELVRLHQTAGVIVCIFPVIIFPIPEIKLSLNNLIIIKKIIYFFFLTRNFLSFRLFFSFVLFSFQCKLSLLVNDFSFFFSTSFLLSFFSNKNSLFVYATFLFFFSCVFTFQYNFFSI